MNTLVKDAHQLLDPEEYPAYKCLLLINDLFRAEKQTADRSLSKEERLRHRKQYCQPLMDAYWKTVEENARGNTTGKLNKAVNYSMNHKAELMKFMENGDMEISNNAVENLIRNLVVAGKTGFFVIQKKEPKR